MNILQYTISMRKIKGIINSENPKEHWGFLPIKDETILDLGCGINNNEHIPTPMYWVQNGAKQVYGIDPSKESYEWFNTNYVMPNCLIIMDYVDRVEKFELYFGATKPTVCKIDVEGSEIFMNAINPQLLETIKHFGIEYHNLPCLLSIEHLLEDNGYTLEYYKFDHLNVDYKGVLHAYKN